MQTPLPETVAEAFGVRGQNVLVTGAAGAIGFATARAFARNGARVMLSDRAGERLTARQRELTDAGLDARCEPADLSVPEDLERLTAATLGAFGRIDALVNCGAITASRAWTDEATADFDRLYHTNVRSAWLLMRAAAKSMSASGGADLLVDGGKLQEMPDCEPRFAARRKDPAASQVRAWLRALPDEAWIDNRRPRWLQA
jgi:NAD(P)-dependent dehydrogenase (short-subunit alcohol dehydrogenase family)